MASPFDRLMDTIRPHLPGAVDNAIKQELFMTCLDFFKRSGAWQEEITFTLKSKRNTGEVMPFSGRIERLMWVTTMENRPVMGAIMPDTANGVIHMPFTAEVDTQYKAVLALTVTDPISRDAFPIVPFEIAQKYTEELIDGILSRMMAQPSKPYTNLALGQYHMTKFLGGASRAKNEVLAGSTFGSQRWSFPQTFNRRKTWR
jgi:hypothetical protein